MPPSFDYKYISRPDTSDGRSLGISSDEFSIFVRTTLTSAQPSPMSIHFPLPPEAILRAGKPARPGAFEKWKNGLTGQFAEYNRKTDDELLVAMRRLRSR